MVHSSITDMNFCSHRYNSRYIMYKHISKWFVCWVSRSVHYETISSNVNSIVGQSYVPSGMTTLQFTSSLPETSVNSSSSGPHNLTWYSRYKQCHPTTVSVPCIQVLWLLIHVPMSSHNHVSVTHTTFDFSMSQRACSLSS